MVKHTEMQVVHSSFFHQMYNLTFFTVCAGQVLPK